MGGNVRFTASAYCQARARLSVAVFRELLTHAVDAMRRATDDVGGWRGHRVFLLDGSSLSMPDTPALQAHFGQSCQQRPGCGCATNQSVDAPLSPVRLLVAGPTGCYDAS